MSRVIAFLVLGLTALALVPGGASARSTRCAHAVVHGRATTLCVAKPCRRGKAEARDYALAGFTCRFVRVKRRRVPRLARASTEIRRLRGVVAIGRGGEPSLADALQAFAQLVHPLPGVRRVRGAVGRTFDGTGAILWLRHYRRRLTRAERTVLDRVIAGPASARRALPAKTGTRAQQVEDLSQEAEKRIAAHLGFGLKLPLTTTFSPTGETPPNQGADAYAVPVPLAQGCRIFYFNGLFGLGSAGRLAAVAHEVFHCFEFELHPGDLPAWLAEGAAEWAGQTVGEEWSGQRLSDPAWARWLYAPVLPVTTRAEDASPFYAQLTQAGANVWALLPGMLTDGGTGAYDQAITAAGSDLTDAWGPNLFRDSGLGAGWDLEGPGGRYQGFEPFSTVVVAGGAGDTLDVDPRAADANRITPETDAIRATVDGDAHGMLEGANHRVFGIAAGAYCTRDKPCSCPGQASELPELGSGAFSIGVNAATAKRAVSVRVRGEKLDAKTDCRLIPKPTVTSDMKVTEYPGQKVIEHYTSAADCTLRAGLLTVVLRDGAHRLTITVPGYPALRKADGSAELSFSAPRRGGSDIVEGGTPYSSGDFADPDPGIQPSEGAGNIRAGGTGGFVFSMMETKADWNLPRGAESQRRPRYARGTFGCSSAIPAG